MLCPPVAVFLLVAFSRLRLHQLLPKLQRIVCVRVARVLVALVPIVLFHREAPVLWVDGAHRVGHHGMVDNCRGDEIRVRIRLCAFLRHPVLHVAAVDVLVICIVFPVLSEIRRVNLILANIPNSDLAGVMRTVEKHSLGTDGFVQYRVEPGVHITSQWNVPFLI